MQKGSNWSQAERKSSKMSSLQFTSLENCIQSHLGLEITPWTNARPFYGWLFPHPLFVFTSHIDWQPLMEQLQRQPYRNFIMFADRMYFGVSVRRLILHESSTRPSCAWAASVACERDKSGSPPAICMISWFAERGRAPGPGITARSEVASILANS